MDSAFRSNVAATGLSAAQRQVVLASPQTRVVVEAGPGTGKTEVVAHRIVSLLDGGLKPAQILVLSFSRSAVRTLTLRLERIRHESYTHLEELRYISVRTFDSWTFRILRQLDFTPAQLLARDYAENIDTLIRELSGNRRDHVLALVGGLRHIIVDEFQDLSGVRGALVIELLRSVAPPRGAWAGFTVLGDPAQAIYGFALKQETHTEYRALTSGALISDLRKIYLNDVTVVPLTENFRSTRQLASVMANLRRLLLRRASGKTKLTSMLKFAGDMGELAGELKPAGLLRSDVRSAAVLTTTNGEAIRVAQKLMEDPDAFGALPVRLHTSTLSAFVPPWIGATLGPMKDTVVTRTQFGNIYAHLYGGERGARRESLAIPTVDIAWARLARATGRSPEDTSLQLEILRDRIGWADLFPDDDDAHLCGLTVMTIHQSKGMEFDSVAVLIDALEGRDYESDIERAEAANVIFVGMTRAAKALFRVGEGKTYAPLRIHRFKSGRERWWAWRNQWINMEAGIKGDVEPTGLVDRRILGEGGDLADCALVRETQEYLADECDSLRGRKVMLCKWKPPGETNRFVYRIHLQEGNTPGRVLGVTTQNFTLDLLEILYSRGYALPSRIFNLRIVDVTTMSLQREAPPTVAEPWCRSGLWLGVNICGTGDFKTLKARPK